MRDKLISVRVNSRLLKQFNDIVNSKTQVIKCYGRNIYEYEGRREYAGGGKYTISDLLEKSLEEYVKNNK